MKNKSHIVNQLKKAIETLEFNNITKHTMREQFNRTFSCICVADFTDQSVANEYEKLYDYAGPSDILSMEGISSSLRTEDSQRHRQIMVEFFAYLIETDQLKDIL